MYQERRRNSVFLKQAWTAMLFEPQKVRHGDYYARYRKIYFIKNYILYFLFLVTKILLFYYILYAFISNKQTKIKLLWLDKCVVYGIL